MDILSFYCDYGYLSVYSTICPHQARREERVAMLWRFLTAILYIVDAGTKTKTPVWRGCSVVIVSSVTFSLQNNKLNLLHRHINLRRKSVKQESLPSSTTTPVKDNVLSPNPSLVDPASVQVIGAVDGQGMLQSPGSGEPAGKKKKVDKDKATTC